MTSTVHRQFRNPGTPKSEPLIDFSMPTLDMVKERRLSYNCVKEHSGFIFSKPCRLDPGSYSHSLNCPVLPQKFSGNQASVQYVTNSRRSSNNGQSERVGTDYNRRLDKHPGLRLRHPLPRHRSTRGILSAGVGNSDTGTERDGFRSASWCGHGEPATHA
jgi:hypothetical protein